MQNAPKASDLMARLRTAPVLADGAMGTQLQVQGVSFDQCFDALNLNGQALVEQVHRSYIDAGTELIETNTFGANRYKLAAHGLQDKVAEVNHAGVELARRVIDRSPREVYLAGSVGPLGVRLAPLGRVRPQQAFEAFREQIATLVEANVDLIILETFSDLNEVGKAIEAARDASSTLPVVASMTFTRDDFTLLGDDPARVAQELTRLGANVIGVNCSEGPGQLLRVLKEMKKVSRGLPLAVMPNAGWPERVGGRIMYPAAPEYFGEYARAFLEAGAHIVGGCCGTTPAHIAAMRTALDRPAPAQAVSPIVTVSAGPEEESGPAIRPTQLAEKLARREFVIGVEVNPPRGHNLHRLLAGAALLAEAGADVINVADTPLARMRMSAWAVCHLIHQEVGVETVLHFPIRGRSLLRIQGDLLAAHALGVRNLFVVLGDPTAIGDYPEAMDDYDLVPSGLIRLVKESFNKGVDHAGQSIGQPTSFLIGCALNLGTTDPQQEVKVLHRKIMSGASFALTQPIFDVEIVRNFIRCYEEEYGPLALPLLVGVLPLYSERHASFLHNEVPGIDVSEHLRQRIGQAKDPPAEGVRISIEVLSALRTVAQVRGTYLITPFSRYELAVEIIEWIRARIMH